MSESAATNLYQVGHCFYLESGNGLSTKITSMLFDALISAACLWLHVDEAVRDDFPSQSSDDQNVLLSGIENAIERRDRLLVREWVLSNVDSNSRPLNVRGVEIHALRPTGPVHVSMDLACESLSDEETKTSKDFPEALNITWCAPEAADAELDGFLESIRVDLDVLGRFPEGASHRLFSVIEEERIGAPEVAVVRYGLPMVDAMETLAKGALETLTELKQRRKEVDQLRRQVADTTQLQQLRRDLKRRDGRIEQLLQLEGTLRATGERERAKVSELQRTLAALQAGSPAPAVPEVSQLVQQQLYQLQDKVLALQAEVQQRDQENAQLRGELYRLRPPPANDAPIPGASQNAETLPADFDVLEQWAVTRLGERVTVHPRAIRAAQRSNFADPALAYRVLQALADDYWPMKFGADPQARDRWTAFLQEERLQCSPTGTALQDRRYADAYHVNWRHGRLPLDLHIRGNSSRDTTIGFRLYFGCEDTTIVVGHLPSHLPSGIS